MVDSSSHSVVEDETASVVEVTTGGGTVVDSSQSSVEDETASVVEVATGGGGAEV